MTAQRPDSIRSSLAPLVLLLLALALPVGCGGGGSGGGGNVGGGGGGDPPLTRLQGNYGYAVLVRDAAGGVVRNEVGLAIADGKGTFAFSSTQGVSEGAPSPAAPSSTTYTEGADRSLSLANLDGVPVQGRVAEDGSLALLSSRSPASPAMAILVRRDTTLALPDLAGVWEVMEWERALAPDRVRSSVANATIHPSGGVNINGASFLYNLDQVINPAFMAFQPAQLTIHPDGWLTRTNPPTPTVLQRGCASADRNLIILAGEFGGSTLPSLTIMVRKNQVAATSALVGEYYQSNFEGSPLGYLSGSGSLGLDGQGSGAWQYTLNLEGVPFGPAAINLGYAVKPDGTWTMTDMGSGVKWNGAVGAGGRYAFLTGGFTKNANPLLMMLLR